MIYPRLPALCVVSLLLYGGHAVAQQGSSPSPEQRPDITALPAVHSSQCPVPPEQFVTEYPRDPNQLLYLAIRFHYPDMAQTALRQGADINASVPPMERTAGCGQYRYRPVTRGQPLPMFVHAFNYGNIGALKLLAERGAVFDYHKAVPGTLRIPSAANRGKQHPYGGLLCHYKRHNVRNEDGRMSGRSADCYDLYRALVDGGYRFDRYDMAQMLTSGAWQSFGKYRYMRSHANRGEIVAIDRQEGELTEQMAQQWQQEQARAAQAQQFQQSQQIAAWQEDQQQQREQLWFDFLAASPPSGQPICAAGQLTYPTQSAPMGYRQKGMLRATLEQASEDGRQLTFRIENVVTDSGTLDFPPTGTIRFGRIPVVRGAIYEGASEQWFLCP